MNKNWADGWSIYKSAGTGNVPSEHDPDFLYWMKGFGAAMADDDLEGEHPYKQRCWITASMRIYWRPACLNAAERILAVRRSTAGCGACAGLRLGQSGHGRL